LSAATVTQTIRPARSASETTLLVITATFVIGVSLAAAMNRQTDDGGQRLFDWQISAFYDLEDADQAIYNALLTASEELWWIHEDLLIFGGGDITKVNWPTIADLAEYYAMPPFVDDVSARQNGNVRWQRAAAYSFEGATVYFGSGGELPGQSAYLLVLSHVHKGASYANAAKIWVHPDACVEMPETVKRDSLIVNGWKEVVPYRGEQEADRLRSS